MLSLSRSLPTQHLSLLSSNTPRNGLLLTMATAAIYSSALIPQYDNRRKDFLNQKYQFSTNDGFNMSFEDRYYPLSLDEVQAPIFQYPLPSQQPNNLSYFQTPQMDLVPTFPTNGVTYNGGMAPTFQPFTGLPHFQTQTSSYITAPSSSSGSSTSSSTPLQYGLTPSPIPLRKGVQKANSKPKARGKRATRNAAQSVKRQLLIGKAKRKPRGPNKRPPGTAFSNLLVSSFSSHPG